MAFECRLILLSIKGFPSIGIKFQTPLETHRAISRAWISEAWTGAVLSRFSNWNQFCQLHILCLSWEKNHWTSSINDFLGTLRSSDQTNLIESSVGRLDMSHGCLHRLIHSVCFHDLRWSIGGNYANINTDPFLFPLHNSLKRSSRYQRCYFFSVNRMQWQLMMHLFNMKKIKYSMLRDVKWEARRNPNLIQKKHVSVEMICCDDMMLIRFREGQKFINHSHLIWWRFFEWVYLPPIPPCHDPESLPRCDSRIGWVSLHTR
jgi:hypothetical protein